MTCETIEYRGFNINIDTDDFGGNGPRKDFDNLGTMVCFHNSYDLGDDNRRPGEQEEYWVGIAQDHVPYDIGDDTTMETIWAIIHKHYIVLPLYLYDHSGLTMNTSGFSCPWDSGQVGWIYVSKEKVRKEYGWARISEQRRQKICSYLRGEVETYDQFLGGRVFGYSIEPTDRNKNIECDDSCWGFYGDEHDKNTSWPYMIDEAKSSIRYAIKEYRESVKEVHKIKMELDAFMATCWAV